MRAKSMVFFAFLFCMGVLGVISGLVLANVSVPVAEEMRPLFEAEPKLVFLLFVPSIALIVIPIVLVERKRKQRGSVHETIHRS